MAQSKLMLFLTAVRTLFLGALSVGLLAAATYASLWMIENEPETPRAPRPHMAPSVLVEEVHPETARVKLTEVFGRVIPAVTVDLQAEVSGRVEARHEEFIEGGLVREGEVLVEIDQRDYTHALTTREAQVESAKSDLRIEQGQQEVARAEWEVFGKGDEATDSDKELALRVPQLRRQEAELESARALVEQAKLDLERTRIRAPFNAIVQSASIDVGDQATANRMLGQLVGTDTFWVRATVEVADLKWITFPGEGQEPSRATITSKTGAVREGRVYRLLPGIEEGGNMAQILIEVDDPLDINHQTDQLPLLLDESLPVVIEGKEVPGVMRISRAMLRDGRRIWVVDDKSVLHFVEPEIVWTGETEILVRGVPDGANVVVSNLNAPVDGMAVRLPGDDGAMAETPPAPAREPAS